MPSFGAVEAGGTKFVCAVGTGPEDLPARMEYPTTSPEETLGRVVGIRRVAHGGGTRVEARLRRSVVRVPDVERLPHDRGYVVLGHV